MFFARLLLSWVYCIFVKLNVSIELKNLRKVRCIISDSPFSLFGYALEVINVLPATIIPKIHVLEH